MRGLLAVGLGALAAAQTVNYIDLATDGIPVTGNVSANAWVYYRFTYASSTPGYTVRLGCMTGSDDPDLYMTKTAFSAYGSTTGAVSSTQSSGSLDQLSVGGTSTTLVPITVGGYLYIGVKGYRASGYYLSITAKGASPTPSPAGSASPTPSAVPTFLAATLAMDSAVALNASLLDVPAFMFYAPTVGAQYNITASVTLGSGAVSPPLYATMYVAANGAAPSCASCIVSSYQYSTSDSTSTSATITLNVMVASGYITSAYQRVYLQLAFTGGDGSWIDMVVGVNQYIAPSADPTPTASPTSTPWSTAGFVVQSLTPTWSGGAGSAPYVGVTSTTTTSNPAYYSLNFNTLTGGNASLAYGTWLVVLTPTSYDADLGVMTSTLTCSSCFRADYSSTNGGTATDTVTLYIHSGNWATTFTVAVLPFGYSNVAFALAISRTTAGSGTPPANTTPTKSSGTGVAIGVPVSFLLIFGGVGLAIAIRERQRVRLARLRGEAYTPPAQRLVFFFTGNHHGGGGAGSVTTISSTGAVTTTTMVNPASVAVQGQGQVGQPVYMHQMPAGMKAIPGEMPPAGFQLANPQFRGVPTPIASGGGGGGGGVPTYGSPSTMTTPTAPQPSMASYGTPVAMAGGMPMVMMPANGGGHQPSMGGYTTMGLGAPMTSPGGPSIGYGTPMYMTQQTHVQPPAASGGGGASGGGYMPQPLPPTTGGHAVASLPPIPVQTVGFGGMPSGGGYGFGSPGTGYGMQPLPMPPPAGGAAPPVYNSHALSL